jgi:two-component system, OmpR family, response regulator
MHILIVEDDEVARDYLAKALREVGHTVDVVADGLAGLHMASSIAIDLAIVDRMLPKLDGLALVQSLRAMTISPSPTTSRSSWRASTRWPAAASPATRRATPS